ncbi:MAG TPA: ABC transporter permease [Candidatus Dormibacteraeota bacterium]|jgi:ABC-type transport system involved in multi-copper enzyme maturation permease subunit|nr:ABC transporter permease [Candidatus Dormibacteraeota bacterium]
MIGSFGAEVLKLRKRVAVWVLGIILLAVLGLLGYGLFYFSLKAPGVSRQLPPDEIANDLIRILPINFVAQTVGGMSQLGAALALILGVLSVGSEYGWGTLKTIFTQRPSRAQTHAGRVAALALVVALYVILAFAFCALCSAGVGAAEGDTGGWPGAGEIAGGMLASWLIMFFWTVFGMTLATWFRQSALGIGIGLTYAFVLEGLIFGLLRSVTIIHDIQKFFPGANATALAQAFPAHGLSRAIRGQLVTPLVGGTQAALVLGAYVVVGLIAGLLLLTRRDVVN